MSDPRAPGAGERRSTAACRCYLTVHSPVVVVTVSIASVRWVCLTVWARDLAPVAVMSDTGDITGTTGNADGKRLRLKPPTHLTLRNRIVPILPRRHFGTGQTSGRQLH